MIDLENSDMPITERMIENFNRALAEILIARLEAEEEKLMVAAKEGC